MLFNSHIFIFIFLPIVFIGFKLLGRRGYYTAAICWLTIASLFFYGWWRPAYLLIIIFSIAVNFGLGMLLTRPAPVLGRKGLLLAGIAFNLGLLGYFKYANFFIDNLNAMAGTSIEMGSIILPLAISFFTFQQLAYLVDVYQGKVHEHRFLNYCLFVTFFPQLIAGPIVHHADILPQFTRKSIFRFCPAHLATGLTIFSMGLFKKVIIADGVGYYASQVFDAAAQGTAPGLVESWLATIAYTFQIYFDFSGYSDMAIGLAMCFGIILPINFDSPYKASDISKFWRSWNITLSRFMMDYVYIPMGGNREGRPRLYVNLMTTMLLVGLWHGAGWNFVVWGGLHGLYLVVNSAWRRIYSTGLPAWLGRGITFAAVLFAWVFFRAETWEAATSMLTGMVGLNGVILPPTYIHHLDRLGGLGQRLLAAGWRFEYMPGFHGVKEISYLVLLLVVVWWSPNTRQIVANFRPPWTRERALPTSSRPWWAWRPNRAWAVLTAFLMALAVYESAQPSEFIYFQF